MTTNAFAEVALAIGGSTELSIVVKATVLLAMGLGIGRLVRGTRASLRHVLLASTFGVLLALPVTAFLEPPVSVEIPISQVGTPRPVGSVDQDNGAKNTIRTTGAVPHE